MVNKETIKNHVNPQALLYFWKNKNGKLAGFNKISGKLLFNQGSDQVCFVKKLIPQTLENEFSTSFDNQLKNTISNIIKHNAISSKEKKFISEFLAFQWLRNPFWHNIIDQAIDKYFTPQQLKISKDVLNIDDMKHHLMMNTYHNQNGVDVFLYFLRKEWQLLEFKEPWLITNEAITSPDIRPDREIYFPITPRHCIIMAPTKTNYDGNDETFAFLINNLIARSPFTQWIIFDENHNPMDRIKLFNGNKQIWPIKQTPPPHPTPYFYTRMQNCFLNAKTSEANRRLFKLANKVID